MILPAISIKEPWATMFAHGKKTKEIRSRQWNYHGDIVLCASAKPCEGFAGTAFAIGTIIDCRLMKKIDYRAACHPLVRGYYVWVLKNVRKIKPFEIKGNTGIFYIDLNKKKKIKKPIDF